MPKKISSLPTGAINKTDNLITASDGSDELKRNTVDELLAEPNADISALQTENAELKAQITEMEEQISELNSNLIKVQAFTSGNISIASGITTAGTFSINVPDGYTPVGVVGWYNENASGGSNVGGCFLFGFRIVNETSVGYNLRNVNSADATITITAYVLMVKNV